jgi:hypothetical protein
MTDEIAERTRKIGGTTLHSIGDITRHQRLKDNDAVSVSPKEMLTELRVDNEHLTRYLRSAHVLCERHCGVATASLIETWVDEAERRTWFLSEVVAIRFAFGPHKVKKRKHQVVVHFRCKCPINFSLSRHSDKLKLIGHQTEPLPNATLV